MLNILGKCLRYVQVGRSILVGLDSVYVCKNMCVYNLLLVCVPWRRLKVSRQEIGATYHNAPDTCHFAVFAQFEAETRLASAMRVSAQIHSEFLFEFATLQAVHKLQLIVWIVTKTCTLTRFVCDSCLIFGQHKSFPIPETRVSRCFFGCQIVWFSAIFPLALSTAAPNVSDETECGPRLAHRWNTPWIMWKCVARQLGYNRNAAKSASSCLARSRFHVALCFCLCSTRSRCGYVIMPQWHCHCTVVVDVWET